MQEVYSDRDLKELNAQVSRRMTVIGLIALALTGVAAWSLVGRIEWLTMVSVALIGVVLIFGIEMFYRPLYAYRKLLIAALQGRNHEIRLTYDHPESELSVVDGVSFRSLIFLGEPDKHGTRDQMYYWDLQKKLPAFETGKDYLLRYTGKTIIGWQPA